MFGIMVPEAETSFWEVDKALGAEVEI